MNKLKVVTLCSGYDSQCMALDKLGIDYDLVAWSEIDRYAIQAHNVIYPQFADRNLGDMTKINWKPQSFDIDLLTYSTPCTDVSNAGEQKGISEDSGTRSSILWATRNVIIEKRPKYLLMENVKALVQSKFIKEFNKWQLELESYGYKNYTQVLNAKDYGVPQNRERVFMISIREDIKQTFYFPKPFKLEKRLKDVLESNVDEKYYLSEKFIDYSLNRNKINEEKGNGFRFKTKNGECIASTILTSAGNRPYDNYVTDTNICINSKVNGKQTSLPNSIYSVNRIYPTIDTAQGGNREPKILFKGKELNDGDGLYIGTSDSFFRGGLQGICRTIKAEQHDAAVVSNYRIRKLTERECFRLMGVSEENIDKIQTSGISRSQQHKMAGNSIVVDCLYYIFKQLLTDIGDREAQLSLF